MVKYKVLGAFFDRVFRNDLNKNFEDIDLDIKAQKQRVDDLIVSNPQPAEVQDARGEFKVLRDRLNNTDVKLAERPTKGNITVTDINKNLGKFDQTYMTDEFLQKMAGTTPINAVPADNSLSTVKFASKAVTPEKTSFARSSRNLFDKATVLNDTILVDADGSTSAQTGWITSDYIPAKPSQTYARSHSAKVLMYNSSKVRVGHFANNNTPFTSLAGTAFIRIATLTANKDTFQLEEGSVSTAYEQYGKTKIESMIVEEANIDTTYKQTLNTNIDAAYKIGEKAKNMEIASRFLPSNRVYPANIRTLIGEADTGYTISTPSAETVISRDEINYWKKGFSGHKVVNNLGARTSTLSFVPTAPITIGKTGVVGMAVYVPDPSKVTNIVMEFGMNASLSPLWTRNNTTLKQGWNIVRHHVLAKNLGFGTDLLASWGSAIHRLRILTVFKEPSSITVGSVWLESQPKAQLLFVEDGGYSTFLQYGYPELKSRGVPVTWALNPNRLGIDGRIAESDVLTLANDLESSFSFHSWDSKPHENMTEKEIREDIMRCLRWLRARGLVGERVWRAAVPQNLANNHYAAKGLIEASRTYDASYGIDFFPFVDRWNILRFVLHGTTSLDDMFNLLKETNGLVVIYTHGVVDGSPTDVSFARWTEFLQKLDIALGQGWLECVTYESLQQKTLVKDEIDTYNDLLKATQ